MLQLTEHARAEIGNIHCAHYRAVSQIMQGPSLNIQFHSSIINSASTVATVTGTVSHKSWYIGAKSTRLTLFENAV